MRAATTLTLSLVLAASAAPAPAPPAAGAIGGDAEGSWDLPQPGTLGSVDGALLAGGQPRFAFQAMLAEVDSPCLSCVQGRLSGFLDDGFGPAPDYLVEGSYVGLFLSGTGSFRARILPPGGGPAVGELLGGFQDPPFQPGPGTFRGRWRIDA